MFQIGDFVIKSGNGICRIEDIVQLESSFANKNIRYYLMVPLEEKNTKLYVPVDGTGHNVRRVLDKDSAMQLIAEIPQIEETWIENDKQREQKYREAVLSCEPRFLIGIIKNMYHRRQRRSAQGKKNTAIDEQYFKLAENNLYSELAFAIGKNKSEMRQMITDTIKKNRE